MVKRVPSKRFRPYSVAIHIYPLQYVRSIQEDTQGRLLVGCITGLMEFDRATEEFHDIPLIYDDRNVFKFHDICRITYFTQK